MDTLISFSLKQLHSEEILGFSKDADRQIQLVPLIAQSAPGIAFHSAINDYAHELDIDFSVQYKDLKTLDAAVDQALMRFRAHAQALIVHPNELIANRASQVWSILEPYSSLTKRSLSEQYSIMERLIGNLNTLTPEVLSSTLSQDWVDLLRTRVESMIELRTRYNSERANQSSGGIRAARDNLCEAWRVLCSGITGISVMNPSPELSKLINQLNVHIQSKRSVLKQRKTLLRSEAQSMTQDVDDDPPPNKDDGGDGDK